MLPRILSSSWLGICQLNFPDCDCACTLTPISPATAPSAAAVLFPATAHLIAHHQTWRIYHNPLGPAAAVALNPPAQALWQTFTSPATLSQELLGDTDNYQAVQSLIQAGMLRPTEQALLAASHSTTLGAWLHVAGHCNLACDYCYLADKKTETSLATLRAAIDATLRSAKALTYQQVHLKYSGGEPLLQPRLLLSAHAYAQQQAVESGINLDGVILSNGTLLTSAIAAQLREAGLDLMISLDGLGRFHDSQRHYSDGRGSFADVSRAIALAQAEGLNPLISVTITERNANGLADLVAWLLEKDLRFTFNLYRENDCTAALADLHSDDEKIIAGMLAAYQVIERNLPRYSLLGALADRANFTSPHLYTCSIGRDYLVFDARGRVSRCQMDMARPITLANDPDPLTTVRRATDRQNPSVEDKTECQTCQWRYWCGGGCPLLAYRVTGSYAARSPYCNTYKSIFPEVLRLEGLRMIKYADVDT